MHKRKEPAAAGSFALLWKKALPKQHINYPLFLRDAFFFLVLRFATFFFAFFLAFFLATFFLAFFFFPFFFAFLLATFFFAFFLVFFFATFFFAFFLATFFFATRRFLGAAFFLAVTLRFLATLRFEAFLRDFFLVAIWFLRVGYPALSIYKEIEKSSKLVPVSLRKKTVEIVEKDLQNCAREKTRNFSGRKKFQATVQS